MKTHFLIVQDEQSNKRNFTNGVSTIIPKTATVKTTRYGLSHNCTLFIDHGSIAYPLIPCRLEESAGGPSQSNVTLVQTNKDTQTLHTCV